MTTGDEMTLVLAKIDAWLKEKEYATGHRTGELLKEAAAEITKLRKENAEARELLMWAIKWFGDRSLVYETDYLERWFKDNPC